MCQDSARASVSSAGVGKRNGGTGVRRVKRDEDQRQRREEEEIRL